MTYVPPNQRWQKKDIVVVIGMGIALVAIYLVISAFHTAKGQQTRDSLCTYPSGETAPCPPDEPSGIP